MNEDIRNESKLGEEVVRLSAAAHCGDLSEADSRRLNVLLVESEAARRIFLLAAQDTHVLREWATEYVMRATMDSTIGAGQAPAGPESGPTHRRRANAEPAACLGRHAGVLTDYIWRTAGTFAVALGIAVVAGTIGWRLGKTTLPQELAAAPTDSGSSIANLTMANGCFWGGSSLRFASLDSQVRSGDELTLLEGIAEFRLSNGVVMSIEAPTSLIVNSPTSIALLYGKVTLLVPRDVTDFRAIAGLCHFTATDAEFGVNYPGSKVEMHVFSGKVNTTSSAISYGDTLNHVAETDGTTVAGDTDILERAVVTAGSAIALVEDNGLIRVDRTGFNADPGMFAIKLSMSGALPAAGDYVRAVLKSRPVDYWRFEQIHDGRVANEIENGDALNVCGGVRLAGAHGNRAAEFWPGSKGYLLSERPIAGGQELVSYTAEAWVKPSYVHCGGCVSLVSGSSIDDEPVRTVSTLEFQGSPRLPNVNNLGIRNPVTVRFIANDLIYAKDETRGMGGSTCFSKKRYRIRRWQHVVVVKDHASIQVYLDGKFAGKGWDENPLPRNSRVAVGNDTIERLNQRYFVGQIDEVAIYDRPLTEEEIASHYEAIDWDTPLPNKPETGI